MARARRFSRTCHGTAPDIAGQGKANPTALLLSGCMMLRHLGEIDLAGHLERACYEVIASREHVTFDLGGTATTSEFAQPFVQDYDADNINRTKEIQNDERL